MVRINKALEYTDEIHIFFDTVSRINDKNDHFFIYCKHFTYTEL